MSKRKSTRSVSNHLFYRMILIISSLTFLLAAYFIFQELSGFEEEKEKIRSQYYEQQKNMLKAQVNNAVNYVYYQKNKSEAHLENSLKLRVDNAIRIADHMYKTYHEKFPRALLENIIVESIREIELEHNGVFFIYDYAGNVKLSPYMPKIEGTNLLSKQDDAGKLVVKEEIDMVRKEGEGFLVSHYYADGDTIGVLKSKLTFVKKIESLGWCIGTGLYVDDYNESIKENILERISKIRFGKEGYVFVNTYDGVALITDGNVVQEYLNIWELEDPNGTKVIQDERKAVENPEGDFIYYVWNKLSKPEPAPKISFIKGVPEWEWMLGAGVYVDEVEDEIAILRNEFVQHIKRDIVKGFGIIILIFSILYFIAREFSLRINSSVTKLNEFFSSAATKLKKINASEVEFAEFESIAQSANYMIEKRQTAEAEIKYAKDKAEESDKLKTAFIENMSHEIRTPLNAILGFSRLLTLPEKNKGDHQRFFKYITYSGDDLVNLIDSIIDISKIDSNLLELYVSDFELNKFFYAMESKLIDLQSKMDKTNIQFEFVPGSKSEVLMESDILRLRQVLINLISNALKYTVSGKVEYGYILKPNQMVEFYVQDTGIGISKDNLQLIFELFRKIEGKGKIFRGTGIGLNITQKLTELLGGEIRVVSEEGKGSRFSFMLKYKQIADEVIVGSTENEMGDLSRIRGKKILVAEDEPANFKLIEFVLTDIGIEVIHADDGKKAVKLANDYPDLELILMDIKMPEMDGFQAAKLIRAKNTSITIIAQTAYAKPEDIQKYGSVFDSYISKPIDVDSFINTIKDKLMKKAG